MPQESDEVSAGPGQLQVNSAMAIDDQRNSESSPAIPLESNLVAETQPSRAGEFIACVAIAGALMGWQAVVFIAPLSLIFSIAINFANRRFVCRVWSQESTCGSVAGKGVSATSFGPACAVWLAVLLYRAIWFQLILF